MAVSSNQCAKNSKGRLNRREAIRARCIDCCGYERGRVAECEAEDCPLYPFRMKNSKHDAKARNKAIRGYCSWCMFGSRTEVNACPSAGCSLHPFRKG
jgi:hypothetical protein